MQEMYFCFIFFHSFKLVDKTAVGVPVCYSLKQWFLNLLEVPNPASFVRTFTEPFVKTQNISVNKLEPKVNYASVAHKILLFKERKRTKHEFHKKTQLN